MPRETPKKQQSKQPVPKAAKQQGAKPRSKEEAIRQMVEKDPERAAAMLRKILKNL